MERDFPVACRAIGQSLDEFWVQRDDQGLGYLIAAPAEPGAGRDQGEAARRNMRALPVRAGQPPRKRMRRAKVQGDRVPTDTGFRDVFRRRANLLDLDEFGPRRIAIRQEIAVRTLLRTLSIRRRSSLRLATAGLLRDVIGCGRAACIERPS